MIKEMSVKDFLAALSSKSPTPGGGGASALAGAVGTALGQMVANLTVGKKKYQESEELLQGLLGKMEIIQADFLELGDEDAKVFEPLAKAYSLPSGTDDERRFKEETLEDLLLTASLVPMKVMERASEMLDIMEILAHKGSRLAVSDVGVGVQLIRSAMSGAVMNVMINTKSMKNRIKAEELNRQAEILMGDGMEKADRIYQIVAEALK